MRAEVTRRRSGMLLGPAMLVVAVGFGLVSGTGATEVERGLAATHVVLSRHNQSRRATHEVHKPSHTRRWVVVLDPGHGGSDTGAVHTRANGVVDLEEKTVTLEIALAAARILRRDGDVVYLTRTTDRAVNVPPRDYNHDGLIDAVDELEARVAFANRHRANVFVSIHINGDSSGAARGLMIYYCPAHSFARSNIHLAHLLDTAIDRRLRSVGYAPLNWGIESDTADQVPQRYADYPWFFVIGPAARQHGIIGNNAVSALGETLYITNDREAALLHQWRVVGAIATGYADGIQAFLTRR